MSKRLGKFEYIKCSYLEPYWSHAPVLHLNIRHSVKARAHLKQKVNLNFKSSNNLRYSHGTHIKGNFEKWVDLTIFLCKIQILQNCNFKSMERFLIFFLGNLFNKWAGIWSIWFYLRGPSIVHVVTTFHDHRPPPATSHQPRQHFSPKLPWLLDFVAWQPPWAGRCVFEKGSYSRVINFRQTFSFSGFPLDAVRCSSRGSGAGQPRFPGNSKTLLSIIIL